MSRLSARKPFTPVKENMEEFGMEMAEGIADAKEQFEKQGINLHNIVISEKGFPSSC